MELTITQNGALYAIHHGASSGYRRGRRKRATASKRIQASSVEPANSAAESLVGSLIGGLVSHLFVRPKEGASFHPAGIIFSIIGALLVLFAWTKLNLHLPAR